MTKVREFTQEEKVAAYIKIISSTFPLMEELRIAGNAEGRSFTANECKDIFTAFMACNELQTFLIWRLEEYVETNKWKLPKNTVFNA